MNPQTEPAGSELIETTPEPTLPQSIYPMVRNCAHLKKRVQDPEVLNMVRIKEESLRRCRSAIGYDHVGDAKMASRRLVDLPFQPDWTQIPEELDFRRRVTRRGPPARKRLRLDDRVAIERRLQALQVIEVEGEEPEEQEEEDEEEKHPYDPDERDEKEGDQAGRPAASGDDPPSEEDELEGDNDHGDYDDGYDSAPELG